MTVSIHLRFIVYKNIRIKSTIIKINTCTVNVDGAKFCDSCGAALVNEQPADGNRQNQESGGGSLGRQKKLPTKFIFAVAGGIAAFLIILIVIFTMNSGKVM